MKILRATHLGMCFGVRDAIALALSRSKTQPVTVLGDLVHNETVLKTLRDQGVKIEHQVASVTTSDVMITAHGTSERTLHELRERGLNVIEATCPLVHLAHRAIAQLVREGYHPVIIGKRDHVEVRGITDDLGEFDVIFSNEDVKAIAEKPRFGIAAQTTQPIDKVHRIAASIRERFPRSEVRFIDTVCQPTKQRQIAAVELARQCNVVVVIGGAHSNNTHELVATCGQQCDRVHHVQSAADLRSIWFNEHDTVGITAGTSTPDDTIRTVEQWLNDFAEFQSNLAEHMNTPLHSAGV